MRIGLIVDHPKRDLAGTALVAHEISKRGAEVLLVPMYEQGVDVPQLKLDVIVANFVRPANLSLLEGYAAAGVKVFVLDTEGGVLASKGGNSPTSMARNVRDTGAGAFLAGYLFWGHEVCDAFKQEGTMPPERLHVTGCPRFDYAAPPWRDLLRQERRDYLLVNANFPLVNPRFSGSSNRERDAMVAAGWDRAYADRLLADLRDIFPRYLATIRDLAHARPQHAILVRPHPFENEEPYLAAFAGLPNVTVDGAGDVLPVIYNASAVLHLNCGTAIEAVMLDKLPVQMGFLNTPTTAGHGVLPGKVSCDVASLADLVALVDNLPSRTAQFAFGDIYRQYVHPFFHERDGRAAARVADVVVSAAREFKPRRHSLGAVLRASRAKPTIGQLAKGAASAFFGSAATSALRSKLDPQRRHKALTPAAVQALLARIAAHERGPAERVSRAHGSPLGLPLASLRVAAAGP